MKTNKTSRSSRVPNNLPPRPHPFVNREEDIHQAIGALLQDKASIVALIGIAGIGKTSLALEIAHRLLDKGEFAGGMIWLPVRDLQSFDDLTRKVGIILGVSGSEMYSRLGSQRCLVALDGLDELNPHYVPEVERFLETLSAPSKALVTSRKESVLPSPATVIRVDVFSERAAMELFAALSVQQDKEVSYANRQTIAEIIRALGYHPLALTLAARLIQGNYAEARKRFQQTLDVLDELGSDRERTALLNTLAAVSQAQGDYSQALQLYQQSLEIAERLGDLQGKSATLHNLAQIFFTRGDLDGAMQLYQESLTLKELLGDKYGKSATLHNMAQVFVSRGDLDRAMQLYQESLALKEQLGDVHGKATTLTNMAQIFVTRGDLDRAMQLYQESLALLEQLGDLQGRSATLHNMAQIFVTRGDLDRAMQLYQESLALKERLGDVHGIATTLNNMAQIFAARGDLDRAMQLYQESLGINERIGDSYSLALTFNNLGIIYRAKGDMGTAYEFVSKSHEILSKLGAPQTSFVRSAQAEIGYELGRQRVEQGRWYDALRLFEESLVIHRQSDDLNARADTIYQIARTHHLMGNLDKARILYRDAVRLYEHTENRQGVAACKTGLGRLMIQMGFLDDALRELEPAKQIYRQLGDDRRIAEVEEVLQVANHIKERQPA